MHNLQYYILFVFAGIISTAGSLDRESKGLYILDVRANVKGSPSSMSTPFQVVVMISDENDNSPSFEKQEYKVSPSRVYKNEEKKHEILKQNLI